MTNVCKRKIILSSCASQVALNLIPCTPIGTSLKIIEVVYLDSNEFGVDLYKCFILLLFDKCDMIMMFCCK